MSLETIFEFNRRFVINENIIRIVIKEFSNGNNVQDEMKIMLDKDNNPVQTEDKSLRN